jgi:hypothetical protein
LQADRAQFWKDLNMPVSDAAALVVKLVMNATLKAYPDAARPLHR